MVNNLSNRDLSTFSLDDIKRFLKQEDWEIKYQTSKAIIYAGPILDSGNKLIYRLPADEQNVDYFERVSDLVKILSALKKVSLQKIINEISLINHDILRVRVLNPGEFHFSLPLDVAASGIQALEKLFLYAASSEVKARPSFERPLLKGFQHAQQCQFGHTFEGSFGFTINTPINLPENPQLSLPDQPHLTNDDLTPEKTFERKVTERIIQGLIDIDKALETRDVYAIVDNFEYGLNSKMCTSLIDLSAEKSKEVEFAIEWSPKIKPSIQVLAFSRIILDNIAVDVLKDAAKKLTDIAPFDDTIIGSIVTLHSNEFPFSDEDIPRTAIIKHEIENRIIQVKLELDKKGYETVYKAHGKGETVKATGKLYKKGNTWRMVDITNVDIFDH